MKSLFFFATFFILGNAFAQQSETLIPKHAFSVVSVNNVNLLQKISLDDLVKYEFMEEVQQELFDGSTSGKTLRDTGIDFDQKLNIFYGKSDEFEMSGFTFGVLNKEQLFEVFDDFQPTESNYSGVEFYESYFNKIAIKGNSGILFRVSPDWGMVDDIADSIWFAKGNERAWYDEEPAVEEILEQLNAAPGEDELLEVEEIHETGETPEELPVADEDPTEKTFYELRDSVELVLYNKYFDRVCEELFSKGENLLNTSAAFSKKLNAESEGFFYFDNEKNLKRRNRYAFRRIVPRFFQDVEELYMDNVITGDLFIHDQSIELKLDAAYGEKLGTIYSKMSNTKFDKNVLKYIHQDNAAFFSYKINMREAYEEAFKILTPILEEEENDKDVSAALMIWELYDEFLNKDALFDTYRGSVFGTFNGIEKVKTKKITYDYDENFEYTAHETEAEEDMPLFTLGFSTGRLDIAERFLKRLSRLEKELHKEGDYWVIDDAMFNSVPLYLVLQNDLFIVTNDPSLAKENPMGYGANALRKKDAKRMKKNGVLYAYADLGKAIEEIPHDLFNDEENEMIDVVRGKSGKLEFTSSKTSSSNTSFNLVYKFDGDYESSGTYILDLLNSLYVISK